MFTSTFKKSALSILSATVVAAAISASPAFAGEGGGPKFSFKIEPDVEGYREYVARETGGTETVPHRIRKPFWEQGSGGEQDFSKSQTQSSER